MAVRFAAGATVMVVTVSPLVVVEQAGAAERPADVLASPAVEARTDEADSRGSWSLRSTREGTLLVWRSPRRLPVTDARPEFRTGGRVVGYPNVAPGGRRLTAPLSSLGGADPTDLEVWVGLRRLDVRGRELPSVPAGTTSAPAGQHRASDPAETGPYEVTSFDYTADDLPWPDFPAAMEVLGHAVLPVGVRNAPLVVFLHGRHIACYGPDDRGYWPCAPHSQPVPSYLGYDYLQRLLASQGYATVSVSANGINAQDGNTNDGGAEARATLVRHHLALLAAWSSDAGNSTWNGRLDLARVVLVGHSRGGEGVNQAAIDTTGSDPYSLAGQILIAPTDFAYQTAPYLPTELLLGYCDGDVSDLQGQRYVDAEPLLAPDDRTLRSSVLLLGANHNFFNSEWTPGVAAAPSQDDWWDQKDPVCGAKVSDTRLTAAEQRKAAEVLVAAGVHAFLGDQVTASLGYLDAGGPVAIPDAGPAVAVTHALGGHRETVQVGQGASPTGSADLCEAGIPSWYWAGDPGAEHGPLCGTLDFYREPHWTPADDFPASVHAAYAQDLPDQVSLAWTARGTTGGFQLAAPFNLSPQTSRLDLRVIADPGSGPARFRVVLGAGGATAAGPVVTLTPLPGSSWVTPLWAQTVRVDPADYPDLDLTRVDTVQVRSASRSGHLWLLDTSLRKRGMAPPTTETLPRIRLGNLIQPEGDDSPGVALLPFTVLGEVTHEGRFAVAADQSTMADWAMPEFLDVVVTPGQTEGTIPITYEADELDDLASQIQLVHAVPKYDVVTSGFVGIVDIRDDDPSPTMTLTPVRSRVRYGDDIVFRVRLSAPVDYWVGNTVRAVSSDLFRPLRTSDVPRSWLRAQMGSVPDDVPLYRVWHYGFVNLRPGRTRATIVVPTLADPLHHRTKALTIRLSAPQLDARLRATVRVVLPPA